jgi:hypothetical protein
MDTSECPICDSKNIEIKEEVKKVFVPMAEPALQKVRICHCNDCNSDIRLSSDSQEVVEQRIKEKANESMPSLIEKINNAGYSDARLERALDLAPHTVYRWKQGKQISATVLALARYIASQPKLIDFAEEGFADGDLKVNVESPEEGFPELENDEYLADCLYQPDEAAVTHGENEIDFYNYYNPCFANEGAVALCK